MLFRAGESGLKRRVFRTAFERALSVAQKARGGFGRLGSRAPEDDDRGTDVELRKPHFRFKKFELNADRPELLEIHKLPVAVGLPIGRRSDDFLKHRPGLRGGDLLGSHSVS